MENIEDIFEISNDNSKKNQKKQSNASTTGIILKIIRDTFVFILIFILSNLTLYSDFENRSFREKFVIVFLFLLILCYSILTNLKRKVLAFFYSIVIFVLIIVIIDTRRLSQLHLLILLCIVSTSVIFHFVKRLVAERNNKNKSLTELDLSIFSLIGILDKNVTLERFIEKKELNIKRGTFNKYKPILVNKMVNNKNEIVLKYSNEDDLSFTILINENNEVYINHWKEIDITDLVNMSIIEEIKNIC